MCLSIAVARPADVLAVGLHRNYEWNVVHNRNGSRCGYVRVPDGHPWHGQPFDCYSSEIAMVAPEVHGGITFSAPDQPCDKGGADDAFWHGFDCAHYGDAPDPGLPGFRPELCWGDGVVRSQAYVEAECRSLCEQAEAAALAAGFVAPPHEIEHGVACPA